MRNKGTEYEKIFKLTFDFFIDTELRFISLFGMLIRDISPDQTDLISGTKRLAELLLSPTECQLVALHLPYAVSEFSEHV